MTGRTCEADDCPYNGKPDEDRRGWHLERRIGLDVIISFLVMLFAGIGYVIHEDTRVTKVEDRATSLEASDVRIQKAQDDQKSEVRSDLKAINDKLDRLIERRP
jgi:hypothetical protein